MTLQLKSRLKEMEHREDSMKKAKNVARVAKEALRDLAAKHADVCFDLV